MLDSGIDGLKRLWLMPKLFDWLVDPSQFFRRRQYGKFLTAVATQLIWKKFPGWYLLISDPVERDGRLPRRKSCICHCTDSLRCLWSNLVTLPSRPTAPCLRHLLPPPRVWDQSLISTLIIIIYWLRRSSLHAYRTLKISCGVFNCYYSLIPWVYARNHTSTNAENTYSISAITCTFVS